MYVDQLAAFEADVCFLRAIFRSVNNMLCNFTQKQTSYFIEYGSRVYKRLAIQINVRFNQLAATFT